jgi:hypothetical protein
VLLQQEGGITAVISSCKLQPSDTVADFMNLLGDISGGVGEEPIWDAG